MSVLLATGSVEDIIAKVEEKFEFQNIPDVWIKITAFVIRDLKCDLILGMEFLTQNKAIINLREGFLAFDNRGMEISNSLEKEKTRPEDEIIDNLREIKPVSSDIFSMIRQYRKKNPILEKTM